MFSEILIFICKRKEERESWLQIPAAAVGWAGLKQGASLSRVAETQSSWAVTCPIPRCTEAGSWHLN